MHCCRWHGYAVHGRFPCSPIEGHRVVSEYTHVVALSTKEGTGLLRVHVTPGVLDLHVLHGQRRGVEVETRLLTSVFMQLRSKGREWPNAPMGTQLASTLTDRGETITAYFPGRGRCCQTLARYPFASLTSACMNTDVRQKTRFQPRHTLLACQDTCKVNASVLHAHNACTPFLPSAARHGVYSLDNDASRCASKEIFHAQHTLATHNAIYQA